MLHVAETFYFDAGRVVMSKEIIVYTTAWCPDCKAAKRFLKMKGLEFKEVDIEKNPDAAETVMGLNKGMKIVPTLDIEGTIVVGDQFNPEKFEKELREAGVLPTN